MQMIADVLDNLLYRLTLDFALLDLSRAAINDFVPFRFRIVIHSLIEAGDELPGEIRPVWFRPGQYFSHFFRNAHAPIISTFAAILTSVFSHTTSSQAARINPQSDLDMNLLTATTNGHEFTVIACR
jgi:hypothetical protein